MMSAPMPVKNKDEIVSVRVDADALARWRATADAEGLRLSDWIRKTCNAVALDAESIAVFTAESAKRAAALKKRGGK